MASLYKNRSGHVSGGEIEKDYEWGMTRHAIICPPFSPSDFWRSLATCLRFLQNLLHVIPFQYLVSNGLKIHKMTALALRVREFGILAISDAKHVRSTLHCEKSRKQTEGQKEA